MIVPRPNGSMLKLAVLGDAAVGKTALILQLCLNKFVETYDATIEDSYRKRIIVHNDSTILDLTDTAGQKAYAELRNQSIRDCEGIILVYSITDRPSFTHIKQLHADIQSLKDDPLFPIVLVGNKIDLESSRTVSHEEGDRLARSMNVPFMEASAKINFNAEGAFIALAELTKERIRMQDSPPNAKKLTGPTLMGPVPVNSTPLSAMPLSSLPVNYMPQNLAPQNPALRNPTSSSINSAPLHSTPVLSEGHLHPKDIPAYPHQPPHSPRNTQPPSPRMTPRQHERQRDDYYFNDYALKFENPGSAYPRRGPMVRQEVESSPQSQRSRENSHTSSLSRNSTSSSRSATVPNTLRNGGSFSRSSKKKKSKDCPVM